MDPEQQHIPVGRRHRFDEPEQPRCRIFGFRFLVRPGGGVDILRQLRERQGPLGVGVVRLFADIDAMVREREAAASADAEEKQLQKTVLGIKKKFGKNAILKGMNFEEGATTRERNRQVGGHRA